MIARGDSGALSPVDDTGAQAWSELVSLEFTANSEQVNDAGRNK